MKTISEWNKGRIEADRERYSKLVARHEDPKRCSCLEAWREVMKHFNGGYEIYCNKCGRDMQYGDDDVEDLDYARKWLKEHDEEKEDNA